MWLLRHAPQNEVRFKCDFYKFIIFFRMFYHILKDRILTAVYLLSLNLEQAWKDLILKGINFLGGCIESSSPQTTVGFPPAAVDGQTLASWTTAQRKKRGGSGRRDESVLKHTFTSHGGKLFSSSLSSFSLFFSPSPYSYGESQGPSDKTHRHKHNGPVWTQVNFRCVWKTYAHTHTHTNTQKALFSLNMIFENISGKWNNIGLCAVNLQTWNWTCPTPVHYHSPDFRLLPLPPRWRRSLM